VSIIILLIIIIIIIIITTTIINKDIDKKCLIMYVFMNNKLALAR